MPCSSVIRRLGVVAATIALPVGVPLSPATSRPIASTRGSTTAVPVTHALMRNVDFYVDPQIVLHIMQLHGSMRSKSGGPVDLDDKRSFIIHIDSADVGLDGEGLTVLLNKYIFAYPGAPIRDANVSIADGLMRMTGKMHKGVDIPFDISAKVTVTSDGMMRIHPVTVKILKVKSKALMKMFNLTLEKVLDVSKAVGVTVQKNDIIINPTKVLPPPTIEGRVTAIRIEGDQVVQTFGGSSIVPLTPPDTSARNFMYFRGGSLHFGKLTMADAEMQVLDLDPYDPLKFDIDLYAKQLVAGYSLTLPDKGLEVYMRDIDKLAEARPALH